jgi:hypothetical protein
VEETIMQKTATITKRIAMTLTILALVISLIPALAVADPHTPGHAPNAIIKHIMQQGFDVSSIPQRLVFDEAPLFEEDQIPAHGNQFINQGYIYPHGFLDHHVGTNPDGTPTYPENVLGFWTCRGTFISDGAHTLTGPWVASTQ